jgi:DNA-binding transcriptional LysR family regulator
MAETQADYGLLATFVAVAQERSFTKAAQKLGIGKGTVSRAIAELEEQMGAELIHRTTHAVALSTAGLALYERTAPHLVALDQAVLKLPERATEPSGNLRMTAPQDFGNVVLPEVLTLFCRRYPQVSLDVRLTNAHVDLVGEGFDLAIRAAAYALKDSTLIARQLGVSGINFYAAPTYLARRGKPKELGDAQHDWIVHPAARGALKLPREMPIRVLTDDFLFIRNLTREGVGIGTVPRFLAAPLVQEGLLDELALVQQRVPVGGLFIVYPSRGEVPRKVTAFRDFLIAWLKKAPLV